MQVVTHFVVYSPQTFKYEFRCKEHLEDWMLTCPDKYLQVTPLLEPGNEVCVCCPVSIYQ